jgi:metal-responsive CopG/Arc/MetJ family transcriptional regulator
MDIIIPKEDIQENDLFEDLKTKDKIKVSITLDKSLVDDLETYKKEKQIKELSPMINRMLIDWIKKNKNKNEK